MEDNCNSPSEPIEIFSGTIWEAGLVKSLLENAEIEAFLVDEFTGTLAPWYTAGGGAGSVKVAVDGGDLPKALEGIREYEENKKEEAP